MSMVVAVDRVSKRFGRRAALESVDLRIAAGEIVGLVGPNGAGKTTLLRIIAGLLRPTGGRVDVSASPRDRSYFAGEQTLPPHISARRWCALWDSRGVAVGVSESMRRLSRGTRQQVGLVAAFAASSRLVLLDEPWEGLDPDAARWLTLTLRELRAAGGSAVVSSHRMYDLAEACDRCVFLVRGRVQSLEVTTAAVPAAERTAAIYDAFDRVRRC